MRSRLIALEKEPPLTISTNISSMGRVLGILIYKVAPREILICLFVYLFIY